MDDAAGAAGERPLECGECSISDERDEICVDAPEGFVVCEECGSKRRDNEGGDHGDRVACLATVSAALAR